MNDHSAIHQAWPLPAKPKPIVMIGAGGIVRDAHLPAYRKAGFEVRGVYDPDKARAEDLTAEWDIPGVYGSLEEAVNTHGTDVIYDLATPPSAIAEILETLAPSSAVLIQKPMGSNLQDARQIRKIAVERNLKAAVNFQLRFSPMMLVTTNLIDHGNLGELLEVHAEVNIYTPWHLFPFLIGMERVEISVHSIHYLDLIRHWIGNPTSVFCRTLGDPRSTDYAQTRTSAILDYGEKVRATMNINHNHRGGAKFQTAIFRLEGTEGSARVKMGVLYDYPKGEADEVWICPNDGEWQQVDLKGTWFPDAFVGTMSNVQRFDSGEDDRLVSSIEDAFQTMALVEACYDANKIAGVALARN